MAITQCKRRERNHSNSVGKESNKGDFTGSFEELKKYVLQFSEQQNAKMKQEPKESRKRKGNEIETFTKKSGNVVGPRLEIKIRNIEYKGRELIGLYTFEYIISDNMGSRQRFVERGVNIRIIRYM